MIRRFIVSFALISVLALVACSPGLNQSKFDKIQEGMTKPQVIEVLGEPNEASGASLFGVSGATATWSDGKTTITVRFLNDKVVSKQINTAEAKKTEII